MASRPFPSFLIYIDNKGEFRWKLQSGNTKTIADSGEGYKNLDDCEHGIALVQQSARYPIWEEEGVARSRRR